MTARIDRADVVARLSATQVLQHFGIPSRRAGDELRFQVCPSCGPRSRIDALAVNVETGRWKCHAHSCRGDLLALVAGLAGLDARRDFRAVLAIAADLAGVSASDGGRRPHRPARLVRQEPPQPERLAKDWETLWSGLARSNAAGERYLAGRGIDAAALARSGDIVRHSRHGAPTVPLRDLATGAICGLQSRRIDGGEPKTPAWRGSRLKGAALAGRLVDLDADGADVAVLCEGLADTLCACLAWPGCAVFGAPGEGQLEGVAAAVAPRVAELGGWLIIVPDDDQAGIGAAARAVKAAVAAGLALVEADAALDGAGQIRLVDLESHHDLADAWRAGWRWRWPA